MARQVQRVEFQPAEPGAVLEAMAEITRSADGWINLLPGVDADEAPPRPTGLSAILAPRTPGALMGTWAPQTQARKGIHGATVGLLHPAGRFAARQLASLGVPVPDGWTIRQDNPRRGLIVVAAVDTPDNAVLNWILAAGMALMTLTPSGSWRADIYLPKSDGPPQGLEPPEGLGPPESSGQNS
jgi:hypothetical protein